MGPPAAFFPAPWLSSPGARDHYSPRETCCHLVRGWGGLTLHLVRGGGWVLAEDLLLSVEYDEFLPYGLQALLEVSILPKSREANVNDGASSRGA